jgi:hypothetical protein
MLTGSIIAALDGAFIGMAPVPFEEQLHIFPSAQAADGSSVSSQRSSSLYR